MPPGGGGSPLSFGTAANKRATRTKKYSGIVIILPGKPGRRAEDIATKDWLEIFQIIFGRGRGIQGVFHEGGSGRQRGTSNQGGSNEKTRPLRKRNRGSL